MFCQIRLVCLSPRYWLRYSSFQVSNSVVWAQVIGIDCILLWVMMKADPPQPPLRRGELELSGLPMYHSTMAVFLSNVCWNSVMFRGATFWVSWNSDSCCLNGSRNWASC